jgi:hypothetical protein
LNGRQVNRQALSRSFQVDDVQVTSASMGKLASYFSRIFGEYSFLLVIALTQAYTFATAKIDRWPDLHERVPSNSPSDRHRIRLNPEYGTGTRA